MRNIYTALALGLLLCACGTKTVISPSYNFDTVKRIGIMKFDSPWGAFQGAENAFAKYLMQNGFTVVERAKIEKVLDEHNMSITGYLSPETTKMLGKILGVDLLLLGEITNYSPEKKTLTMVETRKYSTNPVYSTQRVVGADGKITQTAVPVGQTVTRERDINPSEYTINAQVGIAAKLVDVESAEIVWIGTETASGSSSLTAADNIAKKLIKSFKKELNKKNKNK